MAFDLTEIQKRIEAVAGQSVDVTEGSEDWNLRLSYINRAQTDWAERFDWPQLYREIYSTLSVATGNATVDLPLDFRKLAAYPTFKNKQYPQIDPWERKTKGLTDKFVSVMGDPNSGYKLIVNYGETLSSGASYFVPYYKTPNSLISGHEVSEIPNPNYLVQQSLYYDFLANEDGRFEEARAEAERILANMLESENVKGKAYHNEVPNVDETKSGFRWGRD